MNDITSRVGIVCGLHEITNFLLQDELGYIDVALVNHRRGSHHCKSILNDVDLWSLGRHWPIRIQAFASDFIYQQCRESVLVSSRNDQTNRWWIHRIAVPISDNTAISPREADLCVKRASHWRCGKSRVIAGAVHVDSIAIPVHIYIAASSAGTSRIVTHITTTGIIESYYEQ